MTNDPTDYKRFRLVDVLGAVTHAEFDKLNPEQVTLYLARSGLSPLDFQSALERTAALVEECEAEAKLK